MNEITEGDCVEVMKDMGASSIDCMVTDPPYGIAYKSRQKEGGKNRLEAIANDATFDPVWQLAWMKAAFRTLKAGAHIYLFCSEHYVGEFRTTIIAAGFDIKRMLIWKKGHHGMGDMVGGYLPMTELILFAHKPAHKGDERALERQGQSNVIEVAGIRKMEFHPTEKPTGVLRTLILNSTKVGETVLDPFAGSGSTGVAAREENREPVLIELNPKYIKVIEGRLAQGGLF
jgi:site-specific DNA-methyltransferase (adenine-specific)